MSEVEQRPRDLGPGSSAVVGCDWEGSNDGHWFNAVNDGGTIKAVDGQKGKAETWPPSVQGVGFKESW
ncbi:MAG: toxin glutamine deamidase domain-containing protein, partial [Candidatus Aminicenantales bacterium]